MGSASARKPTARSLRERRAAPGEVRRRQGRSHSRSREAQAVRGRQILRAPFAASRCTAEMWRCMAAWGSAAPAAALRGRYASAGSLPANTAGAAQQQHLPLMLLLLLLAFSLATAGAAAAAVVIDGNDDTDDTDATTTTMVATTATATMTMITMTTISSCVWASGLSRGSACGRRWPKKTTVPKMEVQLLSRWR